MEGRLVETEYTGSLVSPYGKCGGVVPMWNENTVALYGLSLVAQQQDVSQYGMLAEFVSLVMEIIPELLGYRHAAQLILGLRARLILEVFREESQVDPEAIQTHLTSLQTFIPLHKDVSLAEVADGPLRFTELVQTLLKDPQERANFFQHRFPMEFGPQYDAELQRQMWEFLTKLEQFLPTPDLLQTVSLLGTVLHCTESMFHPEDLKTLLLHLKGLHHKDNFAPTCNTGAHIHCAVSGNSRRAGEQSKDSIPRDPPLGLDTPLSPARHTEVPETVGMETVVMETEPVEVVVVSEHAKVQLAMSQDAEEVAAATAAATAAERDDRERNVTEEENVSKQTREDVGADPPPKENGHDEEADAESHKSEPPGSPHDRLKSPNDTNTNVTQQSMASPFPCSSPGLDDSPSEPTGNRGAKDGPTPLPQATRRSQRKPKKTWKIRMVNLQRQKRKTATPKRIASTESTNPSELESVASNQRVDLSDPANVQSSENGSKEGTAQVFCLTHTSLPHHQGEQPQGHVSRDLPSKEEQGPAAPSSDSPSLPHTCSECGKGYRFASLLRAHRRTHTGERPFQCPQCGRSFAHSQALARHRHTHAAAPAARRRASAENFGSDGSRDRPDAYSCQSAPARRRLAHAAPRPHQCLRCQRGFTAAANLKRHLLTHAPERPHRCGCGKAYTYRGALLAHERTHAEGRPHRCAHCGKGFLYAGTLAQHERTHSDDKPHPCGHCGKRFKRKGTLLKHVAGHTREKVFGCSRCEKTFTYKASLVRHELKHTGERPFLCSDCGKTFLSLGELLKHQRFHTGHKPFCCPHCQKSFTQACYLQLHLRYHTGVRPYACAQCGKSFFSSTRLKRHQQIHTGERPHACSQCGKAFRQAYHLKVHQHTHLRKGS